MLLTWRKFNGKNQGEGSADLCSHRDRWSDHRVHALGRGDDGWLDQMFEQSGLPFGNGLWGREGVRLRRVMSQLQENGGLR